MNTPLNVYLLGSTELSQAWGPRQIIAAETDDQALSLARWSYSQHETTEFITPLLGVKASEPPRILFTHPGD